MSGLKYLLLEVLREGAFPLGFIIVFFLLRKKLTGMVFKFLYKVTRKTKIKSDEKLVESFEKPLSLLLLISAFYFAFKTFDLSVLRMEPMSIISVEAFMLRLYRSSIIYMLFWGLYNTVGTSHALMQELDDLFEIKIDKMIAPFLSKILRLILALLGIAIIASEWGIDVNGFVAGLGIGGLAFALAAKDTLSNAFGGAVLITEKPFTMGDWIIVDGVEGVVEDLSFRSTKIRKFDKSVVTVPNSKVATANIVNFSKRDIRRITYELGLKYSTPVDKIKTVIAEIEQMLKDHPEINNETIFVKFTKFDDSSLNLFMYYFTNTSMWGEYLAIREDTNLKIMGILQSHDVEIAFPSQSVYIENEKAVEVLS